MWMPTIYRLLGVGSLALVLVILWKISDMTSGFRPATYDEAQVQCLAAIMRADTYGEEAFDRARAQERVADVVNRVYAKTGLGYCEILQNAATLYPEGWKHRTLFVGRHAEAISKSPRYAGSPWIESLERAKRLIGAPEASGCATRYVRIEKRYAWATGESTAAMQIAATMQEDDRGQKLKTKFFCPR
ncbi:MAG: hypothetical protein WAZ27_01335 [Minisyncoccia bacterium]